MKRSITFLMVMVCVLQGAWAAGKLPNFVMLGDGTMADYANIESSNVRGWGQVFPSYLTNMNVVNLAQKGMSTKALVEDGVLDSLLMPFEKRDILLIQFGENDLRDTIGAQYSPVDVMIEHLLTIIEVAKEKKMHVILCTLLAEPFFIDGQWIDRMGAYPQAIRNVAKYAEVPLIDLEMMSHHWMERRGAEDMKSYYVDLNTEESPEGEYLLNEAGALVVGKMAVAGLKALNLNYMNKSLVLKGSAKPKYTTK